MSGSVVIQAWCHAARVASIHSILVGVVMLSLSSPLHLHVPDSVLLLMMLLLVLLFPPLSSHSVAYP